MNLITKNTNLIQHVFEQSSVHVKEKWYNKRALRQTFPRDQALSSLSFYFFLKPGYF